MKKRHFFSVILPLSILVFFNNLKTDSIGEFEQKKIYADSTDLGKQLASKYCQNCHIFPEPNLLDKKTWLKSVLPNMGWRLGIREAGQNPYADLAPEDEKILRELSIYPDSPVISKEEWSALQTGILIR